MVNGIDAENDVHERVQQFIATGDHESCSSGTLNVLMEIIPIGSRWRHFRATNLYVILGFTFDTEKDEWALRYRRVSPSVSVEFSRRLSVFFGMVPDAEGTKLIPRFVQTDDVL